MSVVKLDYDEKGGTLTVHRSDGSKTKYFLVPPKVYEKSYDYTDLTKFVNRCLEGNQFPKLPDTRN